jgi:hypothetical protein
VTFRRAPRSFVELLENDDSAGNAVAEIRFAPAMEQWLMSANYRVLVLMPRREEAS